MSPDRRRVVVTGIGTVNPLGNSVEPSWTMMRNREIGITRLETPFTHKGQKLIFVSGPVKNFVQNVIPQKNARTRHHLSQLYAVAAAQEALTQAGLLVDGKLTGVKKEDIGADMTEVAEALRNDEGLSKVYSLVIEPERVATVPSIAFGLSGGAHTSVAACATGAINIEEAYDRIVLGKAAAMVAGSTDEILRPETFALYNQVKALSTSRDPQLASMPFDAERTGFVAASGAGIVILEDLEHAKARGAKPLAELVGAANTTDAADATSPSNEGQVRAMRNALKWAHLDPEDINYINAHGTGTGAGDPVELESILQVFGDRIPVSSLKWQLAHMIGAAASAESVFCIRMIQDGILIPNSGLRNPLRTDMDLLAEPRYIHDPIIMKNSFGFGGINGVLIWAPYAG